MSEHISIQQKIQQYRQLNPTLNDLSDEQILSIMSKNGEITLTKEQKISLYTSKTNPSNNHRGVEIEKQTATKTIILRSGEKIVISSGINKYYSADGKELNQKDFEQHVGIIDVRNSGRYSITKNGKTRYYAFNGTELNEAYFKQVENNDLIIEASDGKRYNFNKTLEKRINNVSTNLKKVEDENGFIGSTWSGFKNITGIGDSSDNVREQQEIEKKLLEQFNTTEQNRTNVFKELTGFDYTEENLEKFIKGEIKLKSEIALNGYKEGQAMAVDVGADIVSGVAAVGIYTAAVAAAPFTGGGSIAVGIAAAGASGAAIKTGMKAADAATGSREYSLKDAAHDAATGTFSGVIAPVTGGLGGAVGKTVATKLGVQAVKQVGKEVAESAVERGVKQTIKTALTNPTGYEYVGGNIAKKSMALGAEMATDGAVGGSVDNAFRTVIDGGSLEDVAKAAGEGFVGGAILSPVIGGGMKSVGYSFGKIPFNKIPEDVPQVVIQKRTLTNLYPESDASGLALMKENLSNFSKGIEDVKLNEITGKPYTIEVEKTIGETKYVRTENDGNYKIYKSTQSGSNPGFWVEHVNSGDLYYFKTGNGQQNIVEHVSSQLYRAAGIDTPEMNLVAGPGFNSDISTNNCWIKSKAIVGLQAINNKPEAAYEGFAVDAWLANWDAVCSGNTLLKDGNAVRVDFGGTLNFRARGAKKDFGNTVPELSTLLDDNINPESARLFKNMSRDDLINSLKRVQSVTNEDIQNVYNSVKIYMNPELFETIKNRKTYLAFVLKEAENTPMSKESNIQEYIKLLEKNVNKKYSKQLNNMNSAFEKRTRLLENSKKQRELLLNLDDKKALWEYKSNSYTANTCIQYGRLDDPRISALDRALDKTSLDEDAVLYRGDHLVIDSHTNTRYKNCFEGINLGKGTYKSDENTTWLESFNGIFYTKVGDAENSRIYTKMDDLISKIYKKGKIIEEEQFVSTTVNENVAKSFAAHESDIIYRYHTPKGTKAVSLENLYVDELGNTCVPGYLRGNGSIEGSETEILLKRGFKYRMDNLTFEDGHYIIDCTILK